MLLGGTQGSSAHDRFLQWLSNLVADGIHCQQKLHHALSGAAHPSEPEEGVSMNSYHPKASGGLLPPCAAQNCFSSPCAFGQASSTSRDTHPVWGLSECTGSLHAGTCRASGPAPPPTENTHLSSQTLRLDTVRRRPGKHLVFHWLWLLWTFHMARMVGGFDVL